MMEEILDEYYAGQELDWNAEVITVMLLVELPFWLMMPNNKLTININGYDFRIEIIEHFHELYGTEILDSRRTCPYIGPIEKIEKSIIQEAENQNIPILWRKCKTVLKIYSVCNEDVFKIKGDKHESAAKLYLRTFCEAHIEVINKLIQHYRLATYDYFPFELSPWTVPIWWVTTGNTNGFRLSLLDYKNWDYKPIFTNLDLTESVYNLISPFELQQNIVNDEPSPGEYELLDALNSMERGDYNGAVRRITTAIEVLVENLMMVKLYEVYEEEEVTKIFNKVKNNFPEKLKKYIELSERNLEEWIKEELPKIRDLLFQRLQNVK
jgi:HEPN domain-containing protein